VLGYIVLLILLLTWNPFTLALPEHVDLSFRIGPRDAARNALLFLPVGFLYRLTRGSPRGAILMGMGISALAEFVQFFMPARTPSVVDLIMNTSGAWMGAWLHDLTAARIAMTPRLVGSLALEVPLMGLLYLLAPLLWINRLIPDEAASRWCLTALIGLCGALVISDVSQQWWGPGGFRSAWRVAFAAAAWFFVGVGPSLFTHPFVGFSSLIGVAILTAALAAIPRPPADHRFERATLIRLLPGFVLYLALEALWNPLRPIVAWHGIFGLTDQLAAENVTINFRLLEHLAAFTVLGYITAEWRGRAELPWKRDLPRLLPVTIASAFTLEVLTGFQAGPGASLLRPIVAVGGALFGGVLYHLQRDHVRFLLGRSTGADQPEIRIQTRR